VRNLLRALALLPTLLLAVPASATTLVLFEPGDDPEAALRAVQAAWRGQKGRAALQVAEFRPVPSLVPDGELFTLGELHPQPCENAGTVAAATFVELVEEGAGALAWLEFDETAQALELARVSLACLSGVPEVDSLSRYHLLRGVSAFYSRGAEASQEEFRRGLLVSPFLQWDADHPPDAEEAFRAAVGDALRTGRGMLALSPGVMNGGSLWIDGVQVDPRTRTRDLFEGLHLLQWRTADELVTLHAAIGAGGTAGLAHRDDLLRSLVSRETDPLTESWLADRLDTQAEGGDFSEVIVAVDQTDLVLFHRYRPGLRVWHEVRAEELRGQIERGRTMRSQGLAIFLGGAAVSLVGAGMAWGVQANEGAPIDPANPGAPAPLTAGSTIGMVLLGVGGAGAAIGFPIFVRGDQLSRGRDPEEVRRYKDEALHQDEVATSEQSSDPAPIAATSERAAEQTTPTSVQSSR
jgi:hypothetical protein